MSGTKQKTKAENNLARKIDETDEMKLKMLEGLEAPDSDDKLYPPELNAHLIEQLKVMTCENNELRKFVFTKDQEIDQLNKTVADLNQRIRDMISGSGPAISSKSAGIISGKIADLCKQNRHLVAEVEGYKTKNACMERKIMQLELLKKDFEKSQCVCKEEPVDASPDELKDLNNKLAVVNRKLYESKNRNLELKNDILLATKILQQELGEKFTSIKELQNDISGFRGRAQQIVLLTNRISELEEKLNHKRKYSTDTKQVYDQPQVIREIEMKRKKEVEEVMKNFQATKDENNDLKNKMEAAKCRIRSLECDVATTRQKMQTLIEKSNFDDKLINEQRNEIKRIELYYQDIMNENTNKMTKLVSSNTESQRELKNSETKVIALQKQIADKVAKIDELRSQLTRYEETSLQSIFFTPMKTATDNEIKKLSDMVKTLNDRLDNERIKFEELDKESKKVKVGKKKLERKITALEKELKTYTAKSKSLRMSRSSLSNEESQRSNKSNTAPSVKEEDVCVCDSECYGNLDRDELQYKLELADEKLKMMEDKLRMLEEEKRDDYENFTEMILTSKQLFNEALSVLQKEKCICP